MPSYEELQTEKVALETLLTGHKTNLLACQIEIGSCKKVLEETKTRTTLAKNQKRILLSSSPIISFVTYRTALQILDSCKKQFIEKKNGLDRANLRREKILVEIRRCESLLQGIEGQLQEFGKIFPLQGIG